MTQLALPEITHKTVPETPYLYAARRCAPDPAAVSAAMADAFGTVTAAMRAAGLTPAGPPLSVYHEYDPAQMAFRAGVPLGHRVDCPGDDVGVDVLPAGTVLFAVHRGPYATLRDTYDHLMDRLNADGTALAGPVWEVYVTDPETTAPEDLLTEIHMPFA